MVSFIWFDVNYYLQSPEAEKIIYMLYTYLLYFLTQLYVSTIFNCVLVIVPKCSSYSFYIFVRFLWFMRHIRAFVELSYYTDN